MESAPVSSSFIGLYARVPQWSHKLGTLGRVLPPHADLTDTSQCVLPCTIAPGACSPKLLGSVGRSGKVVRIHFTAADVIVPV